MQFADGSETCDFFLKWIGKKAIKKGKPDN